MVNTGIRIQASPGSCSQCACTCSSVWAASLSDSGVRGLLESARRPAAGGLLKEPLLHTGFCLGLGMLLCRGELGAADGEACESWGDIAALGDAPSATSGGGRLGGEPCSPC